MGMGLQVRREVWWRDLFAMIHRVHGFTYVGFMLKIQSGMICVAMIHSVHGPNYVGFICKIQSFEPLFLDISWTLIIAVSAQSCIDKPCILDLTWFAPPHF